MMIKITGIATLTLLPVLAWAAAAPDPKLDEKAATELRQRADKGDGDAALRLGNLLTREKVTRAKYGNAVDWYKKGCALGNLSACHNAGTAYSQGFYGVAINYSEAALYFQQAAERAFLPSMFNLVILYADARIASLDNREGLKWLLVAQRAAAQCPDNPVCRSVIEDRKGYRALLEARLTPAEQRETRQMADAWHPVP